MRWGLLWLVPAVPALVGCGGAFAEFRSTGLYHEHYPLAVQYASREKQIFLGSDWMIDNFYRPGGGDPAPKKGPDYQTVLELDTNGDGVIDTRYKTWRYVLKLDHRRDDGDIWLSALPLSMKDRDRDLSVLMKDYIDAVSGTGKFSVKLDEGKVEVKADRHRFATRKVQHRSGTVAGQAAHSATFEVASVDQLQLNPDSRWERARIVLFRAPFTWNPPSSRRLPSYPMLLIAGYSNQPEHFDAHADEFEGFLGLIAIKSQDRVLRGASWAEVQTSGGEEPAEPPSEAEPSDGAETEAVGSEAQPGADAETSEPAAGDAEEPEADVTGGADDLDASSPSGQAGAAEDDGDTEETP